MLGVYYESGRGVEKDYARAMEWYVKAAGRGFESRIAQYHLGRCFEYGKGTPKDLSKALEWYTKAADYGEKNARKALNRLKQNT